MAIDDCMISFGIVCRLRRLAAAWRETEEAAKTCDIWYDIDEHVHGTLLLCYPNKQIISTSKRECVCNKKPKIIEDYKKSIKIRSRKEKKKEAKLKCPFLLKRNALLLQQRVRRADVCRVLISTYCIGKRFCLRGGSALPICYCRPHSNHPHPFLFVFFFFFCREVCSRCGGGCSILPRHPCIGLPVREKAFFSFKCRIRWKKIDDTQVGSIRELAHASPPPFSLWWRWHWSACLVLMLPSLINCRGVVWFAILWMGMLVKKKARDSCDLLQSSARIWVVWLLFL